MTSSLSQFSEPLAPKEQANFVMGEMLQLDQKFLIRKGSYYFRSNNAGYSASILDAGFYSQADAEAYRSRKGITISRLSECVTEIDAEIANLKARAETLTTIRACLMVHQSLGPTTESDAATSAKLGA